MSMLPRVYDQQTEHRGLFGLQSYYTSFQADAPSFVGFRGILVVQQFSCPGEDEISQLPADDKIAGFFQNVSFKRNHFSACGKLRPVIPQKLFRVRFRLQHQSPVWPTPTRIADVAHLDLIKNLLQLSYSLLSSNAASLSKSASSRRMPTLLAELFCSQEWQHIFLWLLKNHKATAPL